jgi:hypothetical protein
MIRTLFVTLSFLLVAASSFAAEKTYQVTGPVLDVNDKTITVDKAGEKWEIARDAASTIKGDLKKGAKVTIKYKMVATDVEVKK